MAPSQPKSDRPVFASGRAESHKLHSSPAPRLVGQDLGKEMNYQRTSLPSRVFRKHRYLSKRHEDFLGTGHQKLLSDTLLTSYRNSNRMTFLELKRYVDDQCLLTPEATILSLPPPSSFPMNWDLAWACF